MFARSIRALAAILVVLFVLDAGTASAHLRSGTVAVDYQASINHPDTSAYSAQIYQSDHGLRLTLEPGHVVEMLGYLDEPVFRLDGAGLWINAASPTARAMHLLKRAPAGERATAHWRLQRGHHSVTWHDARVQGLPPGVKQGTWTVPLLIDGRAHLLQGELRRSPAPSPWPWLALLVCWLGTSAPPLLMRRRGLTRTAALGLAMIAAAAAAVSAIGFALDVYASPGTWIVGVDGIVFLAVGIGVIVRGPRNLHIAAAMWVGLVSLAMGLLDGAVFLHPIVLAVLPGTIVRLLIVTAIGAGVTGAALATLHFSEVAEAVRESSRALGLSTTDDRARGRPGP